MEQKKIVIIGGGLGGLAAACLLAKAGHTVTLYEKNSQLGGRAGQLQAEGFTFDTGPSWYLMPDVFEHFFELLGENISDHLDLIRLRPGYRVFYKGDGQLDITGDLAADKMTFEHIEAGAGEKLEAYLAAAGRTYETALKDFTYKNYDSPLDLVTKTFMHALRDIPVFTTMHQHASKYFKDDRLQKVLLYPSVFLGVSPFKAPALYSMLSHTDFTQGVFYPRGGIYALTEALVSIGTKLGVSYQLDNPVEQVSVADGTASGIVVNGKPVAADIVVSDAGVQYTESALLQAPYRDHSETYWESRVLAPSALLMYIGADKQFASLTHHNLLFSKDWRKNFDEIYSQPQLPSDPSLYVCAPGKTDASVLPAGTENLFVLVPLAAGLAYTDEELQTYAENILQTMETEMDMPGLRAAITYKKLFCVKDFAAHYNSFHGTGLGLGHTLLQTAPFRPHNISRKVSGLYYVGSDVHPGIGMPSVLISAELMYKRLTGDRSGNALRSV